MINISEQEIKKVIIPKENKTLGMVLVYSRVISGKKNVIEEHFTSDEIVRYLAKHFLNPDLHYKAVGLNMIKIYNSTLKNVSVKRKLISIYVKKSGEYYIKE